MLGLSRNAEILCYVSSFLCSVPTPRLAYADLIGAVACSFRRSSEKLCMSITKHCQAKRQCETTQLKPANFALKPESESSLLYVWKVRTQQNHQPRSCALDCPLAYCIVKQVRGTHEILIFKLRLNTQNNLEGRAPRCSLPPSRHSPRPCQHSTRCRQ